MAVGTCQAIPFPFLLRGQLLYFGKARIPFGE